MGIITILTNDDAKPQEATPVGSPGGSDGTESACNAGDLGLIIGLERSPGEGNGYPLQYSCWRTPWTEELGRLQSSGSQRVGHNRATDTLTSQS